MNANVLKIIYGLKDVKYPPEPRISWVESDLDKVLNGEYKSARKMAENLSFAMGLLQYEINNILNYGQAILNTDKGVMDELVVMKGILNAENPNLNEITRRIEKDIRKTQMRKYSQIPEQIIDLHKYSLELYYTLTGSPIYQQIKQSEEEFEEIINSKRF